MKSDDLISRQAAIDAVMECYDNDELFEVYEWKLNELPPIQPEIVRCGECTYHYQRNCPIKKYFSLDGFCSRGKRREVTT